MEDGIRRSFLGGGDLIQFRNRHDLTGPDAAALIGIAPQTWAEYEQPNSRPPDHIIMAVAYAELQMTNFDNMTQMRWASRLFNPLFSRRATCR